MCEDHSHWCSNCGGTVDEKEAVFLDFWIDPKTGDAHNQRSIICARCLSDPRLKEVITTIEEISKAEAPMVKKEKRGKNEAGCSRCGKKLTDETPTVALTMAWDVAAKRFDEGKFVMCKDCYNTDPKTRMAWQLLAKLGKNPTFSLKMACGSSKKCATFKKSKNPAFNCANISAVAHISLKGQKILMVCNRAHPKRWTVQQADPHLHPPKISAKVMSNASVTKSMANPSEIGKLAKKLKAAVKTMEKAANRSKDPIQKQYLLGQVTLLKAMIGPIVAHS
ncbi:MAG: hypothetical protein A2W25_04395 [candidate division Zixibacteria bacterium RBG_16_53_22]|nr:MAG: hypothetical protein A2W25_04395 [candidate division Zixibacteria bacterium RBG_16_53_22]